MDASATQTKPDTGRVAAWGLAAAGGIVALVGCLLPWIVLDFGRIAILVQSPTKSLSANAWSLDGLGKMALICSIVLVAAAIVVASGSAAGIRRGLGIVIVVTAAIVGLVAVFEMARKGSYVDGLLRDSFSSRLHRAISDVEFARLKVLLDKLGFSVSFGAGLYLAVIGGILGVVGGVLVLSGSKGTEPVAGGFATFVDSGPGPAVMPPPPSTPVEPEHVEADAPIEPAARAPVEPDAPAALGANDPAPVPAPPPLPTPPDVPPPPIPPDTPPMPAPPDVPPVPPVPPVSAESAGDASAHDPASPSSP